MTNSRAKGARGEREWASFCRGEGYDCRRGQQYCGIEGEDVVGLPGIHCEVKRVERLNISDAVFQSVLDAQGKIPIVAHRKNNDIWLVTMQANKWFELYREWEAGQNPRTGIWADQSGNGRDATQVAAGNRPLRRTEIKVVVDEEVE